MGLMSECLHEGFAEDLAKILKHGMRKKNKDIYLFLREQVYVLYLVECDEAWMGPDAEIKKYYESPFQA